MNSKFKTIQEIPLALSANDVAGVLGISRANAYNLLNSKDFPTLKIGKRLIVPRDRFFIWIDNNINIPNANI